MKPCSIVVASILACVSLVATAQEKSPVKFGKVSPEDFIIKQAFDTGASAVVIADIGNSVLEGNTKGWFSLVHTRTKRIKILNKNGFDAAKVEITLYSEGGAEEKLDELKAYTYNLENGKVVVTKLESESVFRDKLTKNLVARKFTLPAVKEGSIIEYSYTIKSDYIRQLRSWYFQSIYPCLWSEYEVGIPEFFNYVTIKQGFLRPEVKTGSYGTKFRITFPGGADRDESGTLEGTVYTRRWVVKNIPALTKESYTSSIKNYVGGVEFQLASHQFRGQMPHDYMGNWLLLSKGLLESEYFGESLSKNNNWLDDDLKNITKGATTKIEKAKKIYAFVRDNMTCTDHSASAMSGTLKEFYKKHSGNVAEVNLMLTAMLRHEGIIADPLILSTKENGFTSELYPLWDRFNYVVCEAEIDSVYYDLDASSPYNAFAKLPSYCYNGHARLIKKGEALPVYFQSDSLKEQKMTAVFISNDEKEGVAGSFRTQLGYYESLNLKEELKGRTDDYFKKVKSSYNFDLTLLNSGIDSLKDAEAPAVVHYDFAFKPEDNVLYFNPMLTEGYKQNPFKSAERRYPVEMSFAMDETYLLNMEVPKGYVVDEIPKSAKVLFNDDEGFFEYMVQNSGDAIQLRSRLKLNKATFTPEDYAGLRDFFAFIVKKQNEQIVFKKK